jgi:hypothetical protein
VLVVKDETRMANCSSVRGAGCRQRQPGQGGPDVTGIRETLFGWVMVGLAGLAIVVVLAAAVTQFVAWVGAVINPGGLNDKTWFIILLVTGPFSFGFIAMIGT